VLASQALYCLAMSPDLFALLIFEIPSHYLPHGPAWTGSSYFMLPIVSGMTGVSPHPNFSAEVRSCEFSARAGLEL
jgi:hypothetical protein